MSCLLFTLCRSRLIILLICIPSTSGIFMSVSISLCTPWPVCSRSVTSWMASFAEKAESHYRWKDSSIISFSEYTLKVLSSTIKIEGGLPTSKNAGCPFTRKLSGRSLKPCSIIYSSLGWSILPILFTNTEQSSRVFKSMPDGVSPKTLC
jgi:hypothetical protein